MDSNEVVGKKKKKLLSKKKDILYEVPEEKYDANQLIISKNNLKKMKKKKKQAKEIKIEEDHEDSSILLFTPKKKKKQYSDQSGSTEISGSIKKIKKSPSTEMTGSVKKVKESPPVTNPDVGSPLAEGTGDKFYNSTPVTKKKKKKKTPQKSRNHTSSAVHDNFESPTYPKVEVRQQNHDMSIQFAKQTKERKKKSSTNSESSSDEVTFNNRNAEDELKHVQDSTSDTVHQSSDDKVDAAQSIKRKKRKKKKKSKTKVERTSEENKNSDAFDLSKILNKINSSFNKNASNHSDDDDFLSPSYLKIQSPELTNKRKKKQSSNSENTQDKVIVNDHTAENFDGIITNKLEYVQDSRSDAVLSSDDNDDASNFKKPIKRKKKKKSKMTTKRRPEEKESSDAFDLLESLESNKSHYSFGVINESDHSTDDDFLTQQNHDVLTQATTLIKERKRKWSTNSESSSDEITFNNRNADGIITYGLKNAEGSMSRVVDQSSEDNADAPNFAKSMKKKTKTEPKRTSEENENSDSSESPKLNKSHSRFDVNESIHSDVSYPSDFSTDSEEKIESTAKIKTPQKLSDKQPSNRKRRLEKATTGSSKMPICIEDVGEVSRFKSEYVDKVTYVNNSLQKHALMLSFKTTKKQLEEAGVNCAFGAWTEPELKILHQNVDNYKRSFNIDDFAKFYRSERNTKITNDLYVELGENINRPIRRIKNKLDLLFLKQIEEEEKGPFTVNEVKQLKRLHDTHGSNWSLISGEMGRSPSALRSKYVKIKGLAPTDSKNEDFDYHKTRFTPEEDEKILEAVKRIGSDEDGKIDKEKISWVLVAQHVGTRTSNAVRQRWIFYLQDNVKNYELFRKTSNKVKKREKLIVQMEIIIKILRILISNNIEDIRNVNWPSVIQKLEVNLEPEILRKEFSKYIIDHVPNYREKNFQQQLAFILKLKKS